MNEENYTDYFPDEDTDEALLEFFRNIPKDPVLAIHPINLPKALTSINQFMRIVHIENPDAVPDINYDELTGTSLLVTVKLDELNVLDTGAFATAISDVDTLDIIPLADGNIEIGFVYKNVRFPVPPKEKK